MQQTTNNRLEKQPAVETWLKEKLNGGSLLQARQTTIALNCGLPKMGTMFYNNVKKA